MLPYCPESVPVAVEAKMLQRFNVPPASILTVPEFTVICMSAVDARILLVRKIDTIVLTIIAVTIYIIFLW